MLRYFTYLRINKHSACYKCNMFAIANISHKYNNPIGRVVFKNNNPLGRMVFKNTRYQSVHAVTT